jgi:RNA polymerase sigma factor (sigma-70 family)
MNDPQVEAKETWISRLSSVGTTRDDAIAELRVLLMRGLSKSLNNRYGQYFNAEDIVQEALIKILESLDQFQGRSQFTTWAMTIATRIGISALRRKYQHDVSLDVFDGSDGYKVEISDPTQKFPAHDGSREEILAVFQQLIDYELTERQRMAVRALLSGFSTDAIAERMGANRNAVYKLLHDARAKLKIGLERAGITCEEVVATLA